jgi:gamma-glutamylputrescine oxidase
MAIHLTLHGVRRYARQLGPSARVKRPALPLGGHHDADVVVVGGGYAGLHLAIELASRGRRTIVLEAGRVGDGASGRNGEEND